MIEHAKLVDALSYDPATGLFHWRRSRKGARLGRPAGSTRWDGYVTIKVDKGIYLAHRLAWFYVHGEWPKHIIDHRNGNPNDNRISNLRDATQTQNQHNRRTQKNNSSGFPGAVWDKRKGKWVAQIQVSGVRHFLGFYDRVEDAALAYREAQRRLVKGQPGRTG